MEIDKVGYMVKNSETGEFIVIKVRFVEVEDNE